MAKNTAGHAPEDILEELLTLPDLPMHGPEHHAMPGLAVLLATERAGLELPDYFIEAALMSTRMCSANVQCLF